MITVASCVFTITERSKPSPVDVAMVRGRHPSERFVCRRWSTNSTVIQLDMDNGGVDNSVALYASAWLEPKQDNYDTTNVG